MRGYKILDGKNTFCVNAVDCLNYNEYTKEKEYAYVEGKDCANLTIIKKLTYAEFGELATGNTIKKCSYVHGQGW